MSEQTPDNEPRPKKKRRKRDATKQVPWTSARIEFITSESMTLADVARKLGVTYSSVAQRSAKEGWVRDRRQHLDEIVTWARERGRMKLLAAAERFAAEYFPRALEASIAIFDRLQRDANSEEPKKRSIVSTQIVEVQGKPPLTNRVLYEVPTIDPEVAEKMIDLGRQIVESAFGAAPKITARLSDVESRRIVDASIGVSNEDGASHVVVGIPGGPTGDEIRALEATASAAAKARQPEDYEET